MVLNLNVPFKNVNSFFLFKYKQQSYTIKIEFGFTPLPPAYNLRMEPSK